MIDHKQRYISPNISPRILVNIATLYTEPHRVLMEYIDNSFDSAETIYDHKNALYRRLIKVSIEFSGANYKTGKIIISDNCKGMDEKQLLRIIEEIGNSDKKEQAWTNGQFGYGVYSFLAICSNLEIISKTESSNPLKIQLPKEKLDVDHATDVQLNFPTGCRNDEFRGSSGTKVILSGFNSHTWRDLDTSVLKNEIEKHFELLLNRNQIDVSITLINGPKLHCLPYDYTQHEGEVYEDDLYQLPATRDKRFKWLMCPLSSYAINTDDTHPS